MEVEIEETPENNEKTEGEAVNAEGSDALGETISQKKSRNSIGSTNRRGGY